MKHKWSKRCGVLLLCALALALGGCGAAYETVQPRLGLPAPGGAFTPLAGIAPEGMVVAAQNDALTLFINPDTACIAVGDRATGQVYYANPTEANGDAAATKSEKGAMNSLLALYYYNESQTEAVFYSATDAVSKGQFTLESIENGVRVTFTLGETLAQTSLMPRYISRERMQALVYDRLDADAVKYVAKRYVDSASHPGCLELPEATRKSKLVAQKLAGYFIQAGYTWEMLTEDNAENSYETRDDTVHAVVPVELTLQEDHFSARVLVSEISVSDQITLSGVDLLPFFGAGGIADDGYLFVPSGAGAIIRFNNGKQNEAMYQQPIYGVDPVTASDGRFQTSETVRLPVFGIKNGDAAFLAVVAQGEAQGYIAADVSGRKNSYNYAFARFSLRASEQISMSSSSGSETAMRVFEKKIDEGPLEVRYYFLEKGAGYGDMAVRYRDLLLESGALTHKIAGDAPFYVTVVGAIEKTQHMLGVPYQGTVTMTSAAQAQQILQSLNGAGIAGVRMRYLGWFNGGVDHDAAGSIAPVSSVCSKESLRALQSALAAQGGALYADVAFQYVPNDSSGFSASGEAARMVSGDVKQAALYLMAGMPSDYQNMGTRFYVMSPLALQSRVTEFINHFRSLELNGLALRDLGAVLPSDKMATRGVSRPQAQEIVARALDTLEQGAGSLLILNPNAYALRNAGEALDVPEEGAKFYIVDDSVPFYGMVLHGLVDYGGTALNVRNDYERSQDILAMLENGCAPHFLLTAGESYLLGNSAYQNWFSTYYMDWLSDCEAFAQAYETVLAPLRGCTMDAHEVLDNGVRVCTYSDGTRVCVNPTAQAQTVEGQTVGSMGYLVLKGGAAQ